jgi:hypothetical protein
MKAILEFNLDEPEDRMAHLRCIKSEDMASVLFQILSNLEQKVKFELESLEADSDQFDGAYVVFRNIHELCNRRGIDIDELIK